MTQSAEHPPIILASASPYRRKQLETWGLPFTVIQPESDEARLKRELKGPPREICQKLAQAKAHSIAAKNPGALVIGSDQIAVTHQGEILNKPGTSENAVHQLMKLSGHTHSLLTGLAVIYQGQGILQVERVDITFRDLVEDEVRAYVAEDDPWDCAGAYKLERFGICLVKEIKGRDPSSIQGLPMIALTEAIRELLGHMPFELKPTPLQLAPGAPHA